MANTVKHSEAKDAEKLRQSNPKLFVHPPFDVEHAIPFVRADGRQKFPAEFAMTGEGFYPPLSVYGEKVSAVVAFWTEFCAVIRGEKRELRTLSDWVKQHRSEIIALAEKHGASNVRVFGSVARGEAGPASDVDLLVDFEKGTSFGTELALIEKLQDLLGRKVDLGTFDSLKPRLKERASREAIPL
jgi:predicted nucleotidyltransferase